MKQDAVIKILKQKNAELARQFGVKIAVAVWFSRQGMKLLQPVMLTCLWNSTGLLGISGFLPYKITSKNYLAVPLTWEHLTV